MYNEMKIFWRVYVKNVIDLIYLQFLDIMCVFNKCFLYDQFKERSFILFNWLGLLDIKVMRDLQVLDFLI